MSDVTYGWSDLRVSLKIGPVQFSRTEACDEADQIPDWAAVAVFVGAVLAIFGFVSAWLTDEGWAPLVLTVGLLIAGVGMTAAERAVCGTPSWRPIRNG
jgi:hypothetical protein